MKTGDPHYGDRGGYTLDWMRSIEGVTEMEP